MATSNSDGDTRITDSRTYRILQFLKLLFTVVTLILAIWKGVTGIAH